jgi:CIC family chloride channel protein
MIANTIAYLLSRRLQPQPFFDLIARHEGLDLPSLEQQREQSPLRVEDAMRPAPMRVLSSYMTVSSALAEICKTGVPHCVVAKGRGNWSWISRKDLEAAAAGDKGNVRLVEAFPLPLLPHLYPDVSMDEAMRHLASYPVLPVISRAAPDHILGVITLRDIHKAYGIRREERHEQPGVTKSTV